MPYDRRAVHLSLRTVRSFFTRFLISLIAGFLLLSATLYGQDKYAASKIDDIRKVKFSNGVLSDAGEAGPLGKPANFLIVGSDTRSFVKDATAQRHFGDSTRAPGQRSDTIMIAHIDPNATQALLVSFPRDTWVELPGGCHEKINAAFNSDYTCRGVHGGHDMLVNTIKQNFNVTINHFLEVDFVGFRQIIDVIGHISIYFPAKARDIQTGLDVNGGCQKLDGLTALKYARSREYQYIDYATGRWHNDPQSDFSRIRRQQYLIRTIMQSAVDQGARNFLTANQIINKLVGAVTADSAFNLDDAKRLIRQFSVTDAGSLPMQTLPTVARRNGALDLAQPMAEAMLTRLRTFAPKPPTATVPPKAIKPGEVKIDIQNGSGHNGAGTAAVAALHELGFQTRPSTNAKLLPQTEIHFTLATAGKAFLALRYFGGVGKLVQDPALDQADVLVVEGADWKGVVDPKTVPTTAARTTTTQPPTATTEPLPNPGTPPPDVPASKIGHQRIGCR